MIYYIYHSGFAIELKQNILIFDFYKIPSNKKNMKSDFLDKFVKRNDKNVFVLCSHSHPDHFNPEILTWLELNPNIKYILSDDIKVNVDNHIIFTRKGDVLDIEYQIQNSNSDLKSLRLYTFGSTDLGSSFYLNIEGLNIFHAGDLHFWHWAGETKAYNDEMRTNYISELEQIQKLGRIDIGFTPVDPRLEMNVYDGVDLFYQMLKPKFIIPMHFWKDYSAMDGFIKRFENSDTTPVQITDSMQILNL